MVHPLEEGSVAVVVVAGTAAAAAAAAVVVVVAGVGAGSCGEREGLRSVVVGSYRLVEGRSTAVGLGGDLACVSLYYRST